MTQNSPEFVVVFTTVPLEFDVDRLVHALLDERLVACVNVLPPMRSLYRWQGAVASADERQLFLKTTRDRLGALEAALAARHPYEVPEYLVVPVSGGSDAYLGWLRAETAPTS